MTTISRTTLFVAAALALGHTEAGAGENLLFPFPDTAFQEEAPGQPQQLGRLWGDPADGPAGTYLKTPGGFKAPLHRYIADYRAIVIQGI